MRAFAEAGVANLVIVRTPPAPVGPGGGKIVAAKLPVIAALVACAAEFVIEAAKGGVFVDIVDGTPNGCSAHSKSPSA